MKHEKQIFFSSKPKFNVISVYKCWPLKSSLVKLSLKSALTCFKPQASDKAVIRQTLSNLSAFRNPCASASLHIEQSIVL